MNICPTCGIHYDPAFKEQKYCSQKCFHSRDRTNTKKKYPISICIVCGKSFERKRKESTGKYCSRVCSDKADKNAPRRQPRIKKICPECGKEFIALPYQNTNCCSRRCANLRTAKTQVGKAHPLHKEKIEMKCKVCGKICYVKPSLVGRFGACSRRCAAALSQQAQQRVSSVETTLLNALINAGLTPVAQYPIAPYTIDYAFPAYRLAVECDGDYWHSTPWQKKKDNQRDGYLKKQGWRTLRIKEKQIKTDVAACVALVIKALT
jgi:very-short-patch-repair endonuclease